MTNLNNVLRKMDEYYDIMNNESDKIPYSREEHKRFMINGPRYTDDRTISKYWEALGTIGALVVFNGEAYINVKNVCSLLGHDVTE